MADLLPEQKARLKIDKFLINAGWDVVSRNDFSDLYNGCAVTEGLLTGNLEADYLLFVGGKVIGVLEAKKKSNKLSVEVAEQAQNYTKSVPDWYPIWKNPLPFVFLSNGEILLFRDLRDDDGEYIELNKMYTPKELVEMAGSDVSDTGFTKLPKVMDAGPGKLRVCQHDAIQTVELEFKHGTERVLLNLATGSGKTFTACMLSYRALTYTPIRHILYLVDRNNLGKQTLAEFSQFKLTESGQQFSSIYDVLRLKSIEDAQKSQVCICTIQRLFSVLTGQNFTDADDDAEDAQDEEHFFFDEDNITNKEINFGDDVKLSKDFFDLIIVDECHRSIYNLWRKVLEYFDKARIIGLTATPTPQAYAFFGLQPDANGNYSATYDYTQEQSFVDGINVPPRIYRIKTNVTENGGELAEDEPVYEASKATGQTESTKVEQTHAFTNKDVDRSVIVPDQIRKVVQEYKNIIYERLFPDREPLWQYMPKTLFFAKTDNHAELIIKTIKEVFADEIKAGILADDFVQKITCKVSGKPDDIIDAFRTEKGFRIAVTVTLVATGTDVKPLEVLVFMRDIHSSTLYTQMKGRGCRSIDDDVLRTVTPNADTKDCFYLIDAVGVTTSEKKIPKINPPGDPGPERITLEHLMELLALKNLEDENIELFGETCAKIYNKLKDSDYKRHLDEFTEMAKADLAAFSTNVLNALATNALPHFISNQEPNLERAKLVSPVIDHPEVRTKLLELAAGYYTILRPGNDEVTFSGFSVETAESHIKLFEEFLGKHCDDVEALRILYNDEDNVITNAMLVDLQDKLKAIDPELKPESLWESYNTLSINNKLEDRKIIPLKDKTERQTLTNLIQLVRFAYHKTDTLQAINGIIASRFNLYTGQHIGNMKRDFTEDQINVLREIANYISQMGCITRKELFAYDRSLCMSAIHIYSNENFDNELTYLSKFLLQIKVA